MAREPEYQRSGFPSAAVKLRLKPTWPFSSWNTSVAFGPSTFLVISSDATQPSAALPRSCANIVGRCHEGEAAGGARAADGARATGGVFEDWGEGGLLTMASVGSNASTGVANSPSRLVLCRRIGCGVGRVSGLDADSAKGGQASGTNDRRGRGSSSSPSRQPGWGRRTWRLLWLKMDKMASGKARGRPRTFPQKKKDVGQARGWPTLDARAWGASEQ